MKLNLMYRTLLFMFLLSSLFIPPAHSALSDTPNGNALMTDGSVYATAVDSSSGVTYIGGYFSTVGPYTGTGLPLDSISGSAAATFPKVNGAVRVVVSDSAGGWYIGGDFTQVGVVTRNRLAHINSDGSVDPVWDPNVNNTVYALTMSGSTVYVGGTFTTIGGVTRNYLAAIGTDGSLSSWNPNANAYVSALAVSGSTVYAGGQFTSLGGVVRNYLAAIGTDGVLAAWNPNANGNVKTLAVSGSTIYAGGYFTTIGGTARNYLAAIGTDGVLAAWNPNASYAVVALAIDGSTVYAGGLFSSIGGTSRSFLAAIGTNGTLAAWNPAASNYVYALAVSGTTIYAGGAFTTIGGTARNRLAAIGTDGSLSAWNPNAGNFVYALAAGGSNIYAGGNFTIVGGATRNNLAAINADGTLAAWNPNASSSVYALTLDGSLIYTGGQFTTIGGTPRNYLAAIGTDGSLAAWNPNANNSVKTLAVSGSTVYTGGQFTTIGGTTRNYLAAIGTDGSLGSWNPNANSVANKLTVSGSTVYAGGQFTTIGGVTRNYLAAIGTDGVLGTWNPSAGSAGGGFPPPPPSYVSDLVISGSMVYVAGSFATIGGTTRNNIAAIGTDGTLAAWNPNASGIVNTIALSGSTIYAGGQFTTVGGTTRNRLAAIGIDGSLAAWNPNANSPVSTLALNGSTVIAGGDFTTLGGIPRASLAFFQPSLAATGTTVAATPNPGTYGTAVDITATVTPSDASGTVTFKDGTGILGTGTLSAGSATFSTSLLSVGDHTLTAVYGGDSGYSTSTSAGYTLTINPATPTASISNTPVTYSGSAQTAIVACLGGGAATLASGGTGTNAGSYPATVNCAASTNYAAATGLSAGNFVINKATSSITVTGSTSFSYTGSPQGPDTSIVTGSTGSLTYSYSGTGGTTYGPSATKPTLAGTYSVTATVAADTNYNGASSGAIGFSIIVTVNTLTANITGSGLGDVLMSPVNNSWSCSGGNGTVCSLSLPAVTSITLTGSPQASSQFSGWSGDCTGTGDCLLSMDTGHTVTAMFTVNAYTITASAGTNGSISPSGDTTVTYGGSQAYSITPTSGYVIAAVTIDGNPQTIANRSAFNYTFSSVTASHTISATFAPATYSVQLLGRCISGPTTAAYDATPTYTFVNAGFLLAVTVNGNQVTPDNGSYTYSTGITSSQIIKVVYTILPGGTSSTVKLAHGAVVTDKPSLQAAYNDAVNGDIIMLKAGTTVETLTAGRDISVTIKGGYDDVYSSANCGTTNVGKITVNKGSVRVDGLNVR